MENTTDTQNHSVSGRQRPRDEEQRLDLNVKEGQVNERFHDCLDTNPRMEDHVKSGGEVVGFFTDNFDEYNPEEPGEYIVVEKELVIDLGQLANGAGGGD